MTTLGGRIKYLRQKHKLSQSALADKAGTDKSAISMWERDLRYPQAHSLKRLADAFGTTVGNMMRGVGE